MGRSTRTSASLVPSDIDTVDGGFPRGRGDRQGIDALRR